MAVLDVLGWQGREQQLEKPWQLITDSGNLGLVDTIKMYPQFKGVNALVGVFETDSYMIAAWQENREIDQRIVAFVSAYANVFISAGWQVALPLRGCLSVGEFDILRKNGQFIVSGAAFLDARAEFNALNWVGCHATANASKNLNGLIRKYKALTNTFVGIIDPPYKDLTLLGERWVLNWPFAFFKQQDEQKIRQQMTKELGSVSNDKDRSKYELTIKFFEKVYEGLEERENRRKAQSSSKPGEQKLL